jgi:2-polyprenyl-3-methyl-5-hydroxy-6-metoxy-1,4-benzoquinol methylase
MDPEPATVTGASKPRTEGGHPVSEEVVGSTQDIDETKVEAFAEQMLSVLNDAMLTLMTSIGHKTGLFDTMSDLPPSTSEEIASAAKLKERYVREWLGAMVVGDVVTYDPSGNTYRLPPEHAACLTRAAGPDNLANLAQLVAVLGNVEEGIVQSFRHGGGVPYSSFTRFQEVMAEDSAQVYGATLIGGTLPIVPGLVELLEGGITAADIGCGHGIAPNLMARSFPNSRFVGYDLSEEGIAAAGTQAELWGLDNVRFEVKDATRLEERDRYQLITAFDVIHDLAHPAEVLKNIYRALEPGGTFLMVDPAASSHLHENLEHPMGPFLYTVSTMHCMTVSLEQGGVGLGTAWGQQSARRMLAEAGFSEVEVEGVEGDFFNNYFIARKG